MRRWIFKHAVTLVGFGYAVLAALLFVFVETRFSASVPREGAIRVAVPVLLVYGFPVVVGLSWVFFGQSRAKRVKVLALAATVSLALIWIGNTSLLAKGDKEPYFIAHYGVHPIMNPEHDDPFTCVSRIFPPEHQYIGNTLPSIQAAFDYGARIVEIDIQPTLDGDIAVFHDGMLDCKTNASGPVNGRTMDELRTLDVGYGYVTAAGDTPLRGLGIGMMRSLDDVLDAFPGMEFLIDPKFGNNAEAWTALKNVVSSRSLADQSRLIIGADLRSRWLDDLHEAAPSVRVVSSQRMLQCVRGYIVLGWSGYVPQSCRQTMIVVYPGMEAALWGWPRRFSERMEKVGTVVSLIPGGRSEREHAAATPADYSGGISTDRIEVFPSWIANERP